MKKDLKNAISRAIKGFEQSYLNARFATPECTLKAPHNRVEKLKFGYFFLDLNFLEKIIKRHISKTKRI